MNVEYLSHGTPPLVSVETDDEAEAKTIVQGNRLQGRKILDVKLGVEDSKFKYAFLVTLE